MKAYHLCHKDYHLVKDVSPTELIANIIKLAYMKAKIASKKSEVYILNKVILNAKKILLELKSKAPKVSVLKKFTKEQKDLLKSNISDTIKRFIKWTVIMLEKANAQQMMKEKAEEVSAAAAAAAKAASEAAESATKKAAEWAKTKAGKKALNKLEAMKNKGFSKDSYELVKLYRDGNLILSTLKQLRKTIIARKCLDDRRRISTTKTPTMWEIRYVLGIKPGVSFYEKDWKAYKENGFIVVENKRSGQRYQKPQAEIVAAANAERESKMNTVDPYLYSNNVQYQYGKEITPQKRKSLLDLLKKIAATIAAVTAVVAEIKKLNEGSSGLGNILRGFANGAVNWLRTAKETCQEVKHTV